MHGRPHRLLLAVLAAALIPAAPAAADETLGAGQPASVDGVVTSFRVTGADGQTVRLRSRQGALTTATGDPVVAGAGTIAARLPVGAGGTLELVPSGGTVSARVEPDSDGDGYGDTTQDACPGNAADHEAPCDGTTTFGSPLTLAPVDFGLSASGNRVQALQRAAAGTVPAAPSAGVLVRWRLRALPGQGDTVLQLLRPTTSAATTFDVVAESAPVHVTDAGVVTVNASLPVRPGDRLAVRTTTNAGDNDLGAVAPLAGDDLAVHDPPADPWTPSGSPVGARLLVQADVEPDADGDGKGDLTQDRADLELTGRAASSTGHVYTVRNLGPDTAQGVAITVTGGFPASSSPGVTCGPDRVCRIAQLPAGGAVSVAPTFPVPSFPSGAGPFTLTSSSTAAVAAVTPDPSHANDAPVSLTTSATIGGRPLGPGTTQPPALCANVIRGTRDDDVLRGTVFGDRLVGGDGGDLLKGLGGDDCLEGGAGNDVLDGGDGNDRLAGSAGRDRLIGGKGDDKLTGGKGNDRLSGGPGHDTLSPGAGHDAIDAGAGNDTINSVDGVRETVECGPGRDTVRADRRDRLRHCEKVTRRK